ncbi:smc family/structural maintenance of chromosome, putative [Babesia bigemina]|uniref:Structural maintenance of chromosomes protein n=1 Tax=Babesia bigemina TaxID=5866 RepID=A0A061D7W5_BABBI|nr:smc family/structural maintenance of chromosome, putative [Babesia bigemina]CDR95009.1 smc family/structural maintenance of chromosome, putative [Babesia bigemina]|eukprot:XP_012767195.1 smc family/structural maintenance of chromosome, putative [Babesia bigemina]
MHIESIILDGFKSYSTRTVIGPLDPHFNAVTGLNGSGKSNVLDSLCFCLGISDLSCVRASKLDDLIYKQGQAGITKATVTVVLNNLRQPSPLPDAYRKMPEVTITRQIALGGRNRYFLNGHPSTPKAIADFFQCARMNVNNPRFLIMQGRVTKVVNMRPKELLALIEEASGTRIYENKRAAAMRLIQRKNQKLEEIDTIVREEIEPQMKRLKNDCDNYIRWSNAKEESARLERFDVAHKYWVAKNRASTSATRQEEVIAEKSAMQQDLSALEERHAQLQLLFNQKRAEIERGNVPVSELQRHRDTLAADIAKMKTDVTLLQSDVDELQSAAQEARQDIANASRDLQARQKASQGEADAISQLNETLKRNKAKVAELEAALGLVTAAPAKPGAKTVGGSRQHQLKDMKSELVRLEAEEAAITNFVGHTEREIAEHRSRAAALAAEMRNFERNREETQLQRDRVAERYDSAKAELDRNGGERAVTDMERRLRELREKRDRTTEMVHMLEADLNRSRTRCNVPAHLGSRSMTDLKAPYYGQAFELVHLKPHRQEQVALPVHLLFQFKLYYLVARDKECAKAILEHNRFSRHTQKVTVLPLNDTMVGRVASEQDVQHCRTLVGAAANDADTVAGYMDILDFDPKFTKLARYIAGNALICSTSEIARKIAYQQDRSRAFRTATLQGDKFDVGGSMSGGSNRGMHMVLLVASRLRDAQQQLNALNTEYATLQGALKAANGALTLHDDLKRQLEICNSNLRSINERIDSFAATTAMRRVDELQKAIHEKRELMGALSTQKRDLERKIQEFEADLVDWEQNRAKKEGEAKVELKRLKAEIRKDTQALDQMSQAMSAVQLEQDHLQRRVATAEEELVQKTNAASALQQKISDMQGTLSRRGSELAEVDSQLAEATRQLCDSQEEVSRLQRDLEGINQKKTQLTLSLKKLEYTLQEVEKDEQDALLVADKLLRDNPWIVAEEENFNRRGTTFDFSNIRLETVTKRLNELQQLRHDLARRVNRKAQQLYEKMEGDYRDLMQKKRKVEEDRDKIHSVIAELDVKKHENINEIFRTVTRYFADIFHVLLSNAEAKLVPVDGDITNGIEMKVGFNGAWKNSLAELSGGQRSLLALSLILAMLKVRPAPIYILDEVDAALDLSHTQNIGKMIKTQFPNSQFLIVSLKEGMFSNANVLFRTRFVDGASTIVRHALHDKQGTKRHKDGNA